MFGDRTGDRCDICPYRPLPVARPSRTGRSYRGVMVFFRDWPMVSLVMTDPDV